MSSAESSPEEVARLKEEIARLKKSQEAHTSSSRGRGRWRPVVAGVLILVAAVLAPLSVLATWASGQIQDTDRYLETVAPLADDPDVQDAVAVRIEQVVFSYLDLEAVTEELVTALQRPGLPPAAAVTLNALSGPLVSGVETFIRDRIDAIVRSDAFAQAWVEANRTAHAELVAALMGETGGAVEVDRGTVSVNLAVLINTLKTQLSDAGFGIAERIPEVEASFALVQSDDLARVQQLLGVLEALALWLPVLGLTLIAAAVYVARDRSRTLVVAGLAVAVSMLLLGATLNVLRPFYLDALPASSSAAAAGAIYDQLVSFIRFALRGVLVMALTVAVVAWFNASHGTGASARRALGGGLAAARRTRSGVGMDTGRVGAALAQYRGPLRVAVVGIAALAYLAQDHPTGGTALAFVLVTGVVLLLIELLATEPDRSEAEAGVPTGAS
ncbi:MAG: hypothetical protein ACXWDM_02985 [Nocardioides sp.]